MSDDHLFAVLDPEDGHAFASHNLPFLLMGLDPDDWTREIADEVEGRDVIVLSPDPLAVDESIPVAAITRQAISVLQSLSKSVRIAPPAAWSEPQDLLALAESASDWMQRHLSERAPSVAGGGLTLIDPTAWEGMPVPPRRWHVRDFVPACTVTKLSGAGGGGKSLLALQLLTSTAMGEKWLGFDVPQGRALYLSAEDDADEVHRRLSDVVRAYGVTFRDLVDLRIAPLAGADAVLASAEARGGLIRPTTLWKALEAQVEAFKPSLLVIDTLADVFAGDEIKRELARQFIGLLRGLAIKHSVTVLLLAHPSLSGIASGKGSSGSTAWDNSVRSALYLKAPEPEDGGSIDPDLRVLESVKANYARAGGKISLRWRDGVFVPEDGSVPCWIDKRAASNLAETTFLELLSTYTQQGRYVSGSHSVTYAPAVFARDPAAKGIQKRGFVSAMNSLFASGKITNLTIGKGSRERQILALVGEG